MRSLTYLAFPDLAALVMKGSGVRVPPVGLLDGYSTAAMGLFADTAGTSDKEGVMEDTRSTFVGRIKWLDPERRCGAIGDVGGSSYMFELDGLEPTPANFEIGQLVTFDLSSIGRARRMAISVRAARRTSASETATAA